MLTLMSFPAGLNEPSLSNFCTKAMILLNMSGLDWQPDWQLDNRKAPFGKFPVLVTPEGMVGDSNLMIDYLQGRGADLFPGLSPAQKGLAHGVMRMAEENLRYGMMYDRWVDQAGWEAFSPIVFGDMPFPLRQILPGKLRKTIVNGQKWQGLGRFGPVERLTYFQRDFEALSAILDGRDWLMGDVPTAVDASVLPVLSGIDNLLVDSGLRGALRSHSVLMSYIARGREQLYAPITSWRAAAA